MVFGRLLTAMVTPFDDHGALDANRIKKLVDHLIDHGTEGLVVAGTTGESPTLSHEEKLTLFAEVIEASAGRVPVIAGTGSNNTKTTIELTKEAEKIGVDGVMLVAPYYNKPNQEGLYQHFKAVSESVHLPVMIYNIPSRSNVNVTADTIVKLSEIDNIVCVKEASGNLDQVAEIIERTPDDFVVYSGDDGITLPILAIGGYGVISVASHVVGREMAQMIEAYLTGNIKQAADLHRQLLPIMRQLFAQPSPAPTKALLNKIGVEVGDVRLPLVPLTAGEKSELERVFSRYQENS
ncbi:4-hydroxy-tetrahydrodipicolinate synthase [Tuberibacillus calidus]|jgi:4-hydroxy-tetrahydrodipicolinate synthase|uniref:4-hydroxy-tetrahydrodipicolinate synthase n=1 Tax=Tuberibacillus calidus TaxID=340097 RepID=UPI0004226931|nr:4-hydroxy-tetrahydrodipicolinate synthase [Tuberibacillus calidus]